MSGIFAYTGTENCRERLINGLIRLERRGRELSGTAIKGTQGIAVYKLAGSPSELKERGEEMKADGCTGLAQCGNAARVRASAITAAPCASESYAVALDGFIDNFDELKRHLKISYPIVTDEDLLLALLHNTAEENNLLRMYSVALLLLGSPTFAFISSSEEALYCFAGESPLAVGILEDGIAVASELSAVSTEAKRCFLLEQGEAARITKDRVNVYGDRLKRIKKQYLPVPEIKTFTNDFRLKEEVLCLPIAVKDTLGELIKDSSLTLCGYRPIKRETEKIRRIVLTGSGDEYRAARLAAYSFEQLCDIPAEAYPAGELRCSPALFDKNTLLIAVSATGEDKNTCACVKRAAEFGSAAICVTSAPHSYLATLCSFTVDANSDFSCSSVCLRTFISCGLALNLLALKIGRTKEIISDIYLSVSLKIAEMLPGKVSYSVKSGVLLDALSREMAGSAGIVVTGVCADYALSTEAAEKLRSIAGLNAFAVNLSELENEAQRCVSGCKIVAFITNGELLPYALRYLRRIKSVGGDITLITSANLEGEIEGFEKVITFSDSIPLFNWITAASCIYKAAILAGELLDSGDGQKAV